MHIAKNFSKQLKWYNIFWRLIKIGCLLIIPLDFKYFFTSEDLLHSFLEVYKECERPKYVPEIFDCDDFAWIFKSKALDWGIVTGFVIGWHNGLHCWNVCVTYNKAYFIEPQTGNIVSKGYKPILTII